MFPSSWDAAYLIKVKRLIADTLHVDQLQSICSLPTIISPQQVRLPQRTTARPWQGCTLPPEAREYALGLDLNGSPLGQGSITFVY